MTAPARESAPEVDDEDDDNGHGAFQHLLVDARSALPIRTTALPSIFALGDAAANAPVEVEVSAPLPVYKPASGAIRARRRRFDPQVLIQAMGTKILTVTEAAAVLDCNYMSATRILGDLIVSSQVKRVRRGSRWGYRLAAAPVVPAADPALAEVSQPDTSQDSASGKGRQIDTSPFVRALENGPMTFDSARQLLQCSNSFLVRTIKRLVDVGLIQRLRNGPRGWAYHLASAPAAMASPVAPARREILSSFEVFKTADQMIEIEIDGEIALRMQPVHTAGLVDLLARLSAGPIGAAL